MIEGVRLLPWLQEAARREPAAWRYFLDCEECMDSLNKDKRRQMGCGYLPAVEGVEPAGRPPGCDEKIKLTACIGYTTKLPEVIEVSRARLWWDKGLLRDWCDGEAPTPALRLCIEEMEGQSNAAMSYAMDHPKKGPPQ